MRDKSPSNAGATRGEQAAITFDEAAIARLTLKDLRVQARLRGVRIKRDRETLRKPELLIAIQQHDAGIAHLSDELKGKYADISTMDNLNKRPRGSADACDAASLRKKLRSGTGIAAHTEENASPRERARVDAVLSSTTDISRKTVNTVRAQARLRQIPIRVPGGGPMVTKAHLIDLINRHDSRTSASPEKPTGGLVTNSVELLRMPRRDLEVQTRLRNLPIRSAGRRGRKTVAAMRHAIVAYDRQFDGLDTASREMHASVDRMTFDQLRRFAREKNIPFRDEVLAASELKEKVHFALYPRVALNDSPLRRHVPTHPTCPGRNLEPPLANKQLQAGRNVGRAQKRTRGDRRRVGPKYSHNAAPDVASDDFVVGDDAIKRLKFSALRNQADLRGISRRGPRGGGLRLPRALRDAIAKHDAQFSGPNFREHARIECMQNDELLRVGISKGFPASRIRGDPVSVRAVLHAELESGGQGDPHPEKIEKTADGQKKLYTKTEVADAARKRNIPLRVRRKNKSSNELMTQILTSPLAAPLVCGRNILSSMCEEELMRQAAIRNICCTPADALGAILKYDSKYRHLSLAERQEHAKIDRAGKDELRKMLRAK